MSASGGIKFMRPGHRHKRFVKSPKRNAALRKGVMLHEVRTTALLVSFPHAWPATCPLTVLVHGAKKSCVSDGQAYAKVMRQLGFRRNAF